MRTRGVSPVMESWFFFSYRAKLIHWPKVPTCKITGYTRLTCDMWVKFCCSVALILLYGFFFGFSVYFLKNKNQQHESISQHSPNFSLLQSFIHYLIHWVVCSFIHFLVPSFILFFEGINFLRKMEHLG